MTSRTNRSDEGRTNLATRGPDHLPSSPSPGSRSREEEPQGRTPRSLMRSPTSNAETLDSLEYMLDNLIIVVIGASGDLAKKKTYPSLFDLYSHGYLPEHVVIMGYARSHKTNAEL